MDISRHLINGICTAHIITYFNATLKLSCEQSFDSELIHHCRMFKLFNVFFRAGPLDASDIVCLSSITKKKQKTIKWAVSHRFTIELTKFKLHTQRLMVRTTSSGSWIWSLRWIISCKFLHFCSSKR